MQLFETINRARQMHCYIREHEKKYTFGGSIEKKQMYARTLHGAGISLSM